MRSKSINMEKYILIYDTTLREGEQVAGLFFTSKQKKYIASELISAGIKHLEIGIIGNSEDEKVYFDLYHKFGQQNTELAMTLLPFEKPLKRAIDEPFLNINIAFPSTRFFSKYCFLREQNIIIKRIERIIPLIISKNKKLRCVLVDASRQNLTKILKQIEFFINLGISSIIISDSVGIYTPQNVSQIIMEILNKFPSLELGVHMHNDFGLAVANSITAVQFGATLVQVSINGLGERAGIASTAEVLFALKFLCGFDTNIDLKKICDLSKKMQKITGIVNSLNKPLIGKSIFWSETAAHLFAILSGHPEIVSPILPEVVGEKQKIVFGKHTSQHLLELIEENMKYKLKYKSLEQLKKIAFARRAKFLKQIRKCIQEYEKYYEKSLLMITKNE
jgi:2-isopropylmalate synthase